MGESASVMVRVANARVRTIEEETITLKEEIDSVNRLTDQDQLDIRAEELIITQMSMPGELESGWSYLRKAAEKMSSEGRVAAGQLYYTLAANSVTLTVTLEQLVKDKVRDPKIRATGLRELPTVTDKLKALRERTWKEWPWFSEEDVKEAREAEAKGELLDADVAFAEVAGVDVQEWLRSVEARKAGGAS
jgi:hypothetical protein